MPIGWQPNVLYQADDTETVKEVDRILRERPKGELAKILSGKGIAPQCKLVG
jgi:hypothetical protein